MSCELRDELMPNTNSCSNKIGIGICEERVYFIDHSFAALLYSYNFVLVGSLYALSVVALPEDADQEPTHSLEIVLHLPQLGHHFYRICFSCCLLNLRVLFRIRNAQLGC